MENRRTIRALEAYQIEVKGHIDQKWSDWFDGFSIIPQENGNCLLVGSVPDQAALHGLLAKIHDLGLPLRMVEKIEGEQTGGEDA